MKITDIINALQANRVQITDHADEEAESDKLKIDEIYFSVQYGEVIEELPNGQTLSKLSDLWAVL